MVFQQWKLLEISTIMRISMNIHFKVSFKNVITEMKTFKMRQSTGIIL